MSTENITKFSEAVAASPDLQAKVQSIHATAARDTAARIAALSAETDAPFTVEEFLASANSAQAELTDEQLEVVAGGNREVLGRVAASIFTAGLACLIMYQNSQNGDRPQNCM